MRFLRLCHFKHTLAWS